MSLEDGVWINAAPGLNIHSYGDDRGEALRSFCEDFNVLYDEIASAPDESLTEDAIKVKGAFDTVVESVVSKKWA